MKRILTFLALLACLLVPSALRAQITDASVCDILANPQSFDGKMVRIQGRVIAGFDEFAVQGADCKQLVNAIWLAYPEGTKGNAGPAAFLRLQLAKNHAAKAGQVTRAAVKLDRNKDLEDFDKLLSTPAKTKGLCLGCVQYTVTATLVGRLDGAADTGLIRNGKGRIIGLGGFGNLNRYNARLVLQSVSNVAAQEIDYTKDGAAAENLAATIPFFTSGSSGLIQLKQSMDAFGAPGEDNGVSVGFGGANEIPKDDSAKSSATSPDGLLFNATFDSNRLKGPALNVAMSHVGTHIADLRSEDIDLQIENLYGAEFRAWQTSVLSAQASKVKTLTLPGSYTIYSQSWPDSNLVKNANGGMAGFLANWAGLASPPQP